MTDATVIRHIFGMVAISILGGLWVYWALGRWTR